MTLNYTTLTDIQQDLQNKKVNCEQLVDFYLANIQKRNHEVNAFIEVFEEEARARAKQIDEKILLNKAGRLAGMVIGIKDILCYQDHVCTAGSKILTGFKSQFTSTAIQRLIDEDVIIIGRQNCDEFGMGSTNENSFYGPTKNAADLTKVTGGSSGGSAVSVQANFCHASIGSDTGGSVRMPAGYCGTVGLKPSYSRVSRWGLIAYASSFDTIGPITKSVYDAALLLEIMSGYDENDSTVSTKKVPEYSKNLLTNISKKYKVAYYKQCLEQGLDLEVKDAFLNKIEAIKAAGHQVEAIDFPLINSLLPTYYILTTAEVSSNLNRFDGVKYGHRSKESTDLMSLYKKTRTEGLGLEAQKRVMLGTFVLSANYYDAYYTKAQRVRRLIKEQSDQLFTEFDFVISPTSATTAFEIGAKSEDSISMFLTDLFTVEANVVGCPAIAIPNGVDRNNLPIGFQLMAGSFEEEKLLAFAKFLELK